jgi:hypothetical protein
MNRTLLSKQRGAATLAVFAAVATAGTTTGALILARPAWSRQSPQQRADGRRRVAAASSRAGAPRSATRLGKFQLVHGPGQLTALPDGTIRGDVSRANFSSTRYDFGAPRVQFTFRNIVRTANATGGVRVVYRVPAQKQVTTLTCNSATFVAATAPGGSDRIDLRGDLRSTTENPAWAAPFVQRSESGTIFFRPNGETVLEVGAGTIEGQTYEPERRPRPAAGGNNSSPEQR